jgi:hypothetical protein
MRVREPTHGRNSSLFGDTGIDDKHADGEYCGDSQN